MVVAPQAPSININVNSKTVERIEESREKYRISLKDTKYFLIAYFTIFAVYIITLIVNFQLAMKYMFYFFLMLLIPYFILSMKSFWISRKRRKEYNKILNSELNNKLYDNIVVFFKDDGNNPILKNYQIGKQVFLDTRFTFNKTHEIKRYAYNNGFDAVVDLQILKNGVAVFYLAKKKQ